MKIRITESFDKIKKALKDSGYFAIGKVDETGFILPDGDFLNTADNTYGMQWHNDVEAFLRESGLENVEAEEISANNDSGDGSPTLEAFGAIRVSSGESYICLPPIRPTEQAFATLDEWLDNYISVWDFSNRTPWIYVCNYEGDVDNDYDPTDDDVVKKIKRYYSSGRLVEKFTEAYDRELGCYFTNNPLELAKYAKHNSGDEEVLLRIVRMKSSHDDVMYLAANAYDKTHGDLIRIGEKMGYDPLQTTVYYSYPDKGEGDRSSEDYYIDYEDVNVEIRRFGDFRLATVQDGYDDGKELIDAFGNPVEVFDYERSYLESLNESKEDQQRFFDWIYNGLISKGYGESPAKTRAKELYDEFMSHKQSLKSPENDIYYWMKKDAFWDFVNGFMVDLRKKDEEKKRKSKSESEGARLVFSDADWFVYEITTYEASAKYGKGTKWCISGSERWGNGEDGKDYWNRYALHGVRFFFFINRKSNDKYALAIYPDHEHYEIFNSADLSVPAIPDAPLVRELLDMMGRHDAFYARLDPEREIELSIAKGKADFDFIKPYLDNCNFNYNDGNLTLVKGARDFVDMLDISIPDDYLEWEATSNGLMAKDEFRRLTGYDFDDESEWTGDFPSIQNWDELPGWESGKRYIMSPNRYDDDAYYLFSSDFDDSRWSERKTLQDALLEMSRYSPHIISEITDKITTDITKGDVSVDEAAQAFDLSDDAIEQFKWASGKRGLLGESSKRGLREMNDDSINETMDEISEKIEKHEELNQKLFEGDKLKEDVREKILEIADEFVNGLKEDEIKFDVKDVVLVGSNVSYNYTEDSDLDIHIIADSTNLDCPDELYPLLYSAYRSLFNKDYDITIKGIPAEIYVEIDEPQGKSNGVYSVKNDDWIKKPEIENIPDVDEEAFDREFEKWEDRYFELKDEIESELVKTEHPLDESLLRESKEDTEKFVKWVEKSYDEVGYQWADPSVDVSDDMSSANDVIDVFDWYRHDNSGEQTDYYYWMKRDASEFFNFIARLLRKSKDKEDLSDKQNEGAEKIYEDSIWRVYKITTPEAAQKYGRGTTWCITNKGDFKDYFEWRDVSYFLFVLPKDESKYMKYAVGFGADDELETELFDQEDCVVAGIPDIPDVSQLREHFSDAKLFHFDEYFVDDENGQTLVNIHDTVEMDYPWLNYLWFLLDDEDEIKDKLSEYSGIKVESLLRESKEDIQRFIDKFGDELYKLFVNSKDRLKNVGKTTDMNFYTKNVEVDELRKLLYGLRAKTGSVDDEESQGKSRYLGSANGYDVYEPLDVESSMALGVGTGWCTTGRYGHAGDLNFKPSLERAEEHWEEYTSKGIRFFYFLQNGIGKYALALYPKILNVNEKINQKTFLRRTNFELFDQYDKLDYKDLEELPLNLIKDGIVLEKEDLYADVTEIKLKSGKKANLVVYNKSPLVVGWEASSAPKSVWENLQQTIIKWYDDEFPDELKEQYPRDTLHSLCVENLVSGKNAPKWAEPISDKARAFRLEYFSNISYNKRCEKRQYYDWYWLENACSGSSSNACDVDGGLGSVYDSNWYSFDMVRPAFFLNQKSTDK